MLHALGYDNVLTYHMNEGHSRPFDHGPSGTGNGGARYLLSNPGRQGSHSKTMRVYHPYAGSRRSRPVSARLGAAGAGEELTVALEAAECLLNGELNMTHLALVFSRYVNGVSMRHEEISVTCSPAIQ